MTPKVIAFLSDEQRKERLLFQKKYKMYLFDFQTNTVGLLKNI